MSPYVIRSLFLLRDLGFDIPQATIDNGINFVVGLLDNGSSMFVSDPDFRAEVFWTLAKAKHERASTLLRDIEPTKLRGHGYLAYAYGLYYLGKLTDEVSAQLAFRMKQIKNTDDYWYWDMDSDNAIYASLLLDRGKTAEATTILDNLMREVDVSSYFVSTQTKIQTLAALVKQATLDISK